MSRLVCSYQYVNERGELLFEVCRWDPKGFSQRQPDHEKGGWKRQRDRDGKMRLSMTGCRLVPYRLDQLTAARVEMVEDGIVPLALILEGEKDADRAARGGMLATTCPGGARKWRPEFAQYFQGFEVALVPHNDPPGRDHMNEVAKSVLPVASTTRLINLGMAEVGADFCDWADRGHTRAELKALIAATPVLTMADLPTPAAPPKRPVRALPDRLSPYAKTALERAVQAIRQAPNGSQQKILNAEAFGIAQLVAGGLLPEGSAFTLLRTAAGDMVSYDPRRLWRPAELDRIVRRSFEEGLRQPRGIPPEPRERRYG
jgi:hypothetical protein